MGMRAGSTVVGLLLVLPRVAAAEPPARAVDVTIRVYDTAGLPADALQRALDTAAALVSEASVTSSWRVCRQRSADPTAQGDTPCRQPVAPGELVVRVVHARVDVRRGPFLPLGDAMIDAQARSGVLATIYADRVRWTAHEAGVDPWTLLGRAIAHELGHLLMASTTHGSDGLMRAAWLREELRRDHADDWSFAPGEATVIRERAALTRRSSRGGPRRPG